MPAPDSLQPQPPRIEVLYAAPSRRGATIVAGIAALTLSMGVLWILARVLHSLLLAGVSLAICLLVLAAGTLTRRQQLLRPRRVLADHSTRSVRIEHRRGVAVIRFEDCASITQEAPVMGDGVSLDTVVLTGRDGTRTILSVIDRDAAEGVVRALHAVMDPPGETPS